MKSVCRIAVEADVNEELSQLNWHFESGRLFHHFFPGAIVFQQIERDRRNFKSWKHNLVDGSQIFKTGCSFEVDEQQS